MDSPLGAVWPPAVSGSGALSGPSGTAARRRVPWSRAFLVRTRVDGPLSVSCQFSWPASPASRVGRKCWRIEASFADVVLLLGVLSPWFSLTWGPRPDPGPAALSALTRVVVLEVPCERRALCSRARFGGPDGCDRGAPGRAGCPQGA